MALLPETLISSSLHFHASWHFFFLFFRRSFDIEKVLHFPTLCCIHVSTLKETNVCKFCETLGACLEYIQCILLWLVYFIINGELQVHHELGVVVYFFGWVQLDSGKTSGSRVIEMTKTLLTYEKKKYAYVYSRACFESWWVMLMMNLLTTEWIQTFLQVCSASIIAFTFTKIHSFHLILDVFTIFIYFYVLCD